VFSGQEALGPLVAKTGTITIGTLLVLIVFKALAWGVSLGSFRGGPVFPAMSIDAAGGIAASHLPGLPSSAAIPVAMDAMIVAFLRLPLSAIIIASLLCASAGPGGGPLVIVGVVVAYLTTLALEERIGPPTTQPATSQQTPGGRWPLAGAGHHHGRDADGEVGFDAGDPTAPIAVMAADAQNRRCRLDGGRISSVSVGFRLRLGDGGRAGKSSGSRLATTKYHRKPPGVGDIARTSTKPAPTGRTTADTSPEAVGRFAGLRNGGCDSSRLLDSPTDRQGSCTTKDRSTDLPGLLPCRRGT
jgi:hypothetical protein